MRRIDYLFGQVVSGSLGAQALGRVPMNVDSEEQVRFAERAWNFAVVLDEVCASKNIPSDVVLMEGLVRRFSSDEISRLRILLREENPSQFE